MAIALGIRHLLLSQPSVSSLCPQQSVSGITYQGVFNEYPAQGFAAPFILVHLISHDPMKALDGTTGMATTEFDIDCWGATYPQASNLADAVELFLKDYSGAAGGNDTIRAVLFNNRRHDLVAPLDGSDKRLHVTSLSFDIQHVAN